MTISLPPISYPAKPKAPFTGTPPQNLFPDRFPTEWKNITGKPYITVSSKGLANGQSEYINDGADFGPDSLQADGTLTVTGGMQEAGEYSYSKYGYTHIMLLGGVINVSATTYLHSDYFVLIEGQSGINQSVVSTIQQNAAVPVFQNYSATSSVTTHMFKDFVIDLNIGTNTIKVLDFESETTVYNIDSIFLDHVSFHPDSSGTKGNYLLYNSNAFFRTYTNVVDSVNSGFILYTKSYVNAPSTLWISGYGYISDIVASVRQIFISDTNWYGNLTVDNSAATPLSIDIHDIKYQPQTTLSNTSMITINSNLVNLTLKTIDMLTYQNLPNMIEFSGTSTTPITINKVYLEDISFIYNPPSTGTYTCNLYATSYATVDELKCNMIRALSDKITLTGVDEILPTPTLSANPPVSATVYQNTNPYDIEIDLPVYATTAGTAGYVTIAKGATSTPTAIGNQFVSGSTSSTSTDIIKLRVPAGWYYSFTGSGVTFATATPFAE